MNGFVVALWRAQTMQNADGSYMYCYIIDIKHMCHILYIIWNYVHCTYKFSIFNFFIIIISPTTRCFGLESPRSNCTSTYGITNDVKN